MEEVAKLFPGLGIFALTGVLAFVIALLGIRSLRLVDAFIEILQKSEGLEKKKPCTDAPSCTQELKEIRTVLGSIQQELAKLPNTPLFTQAEGIREQLGHITQQLTSLTGITPHIQELPKIHTALESIRQLLVEFPRTISIIQELHELRARVDDIQQRIPPLPPEETE